MSFTENEISNNVHISDRYSNFDVLRTPEKVITAGIILKLDITLIFTFKH